MDGETVPSPTQWTLVEKCMGVVWAEGDHFGFYLTGEDTQKPHVHFLTQDSNTVTMNGVDVSATCTFDMPLHTGSVMRYLPENGKSVYNLVVTTKSFMQKVTAQIFVYETGKRFLFAQNEVSVGSDCSSDIVLEDAAPKHLIISRVDRGFNVKATDNSGFSYFDDQDFHDEASDNDDITWCNFGESTFVDDSHKICIREKYKPPLQDMVTWTQKDYDEYRCDPGQGLTDEEFDELEARPENSIAAGPDEKVIYTIQLLQFDPRLLEISSTEKAQRHAMSVKRDGDADTDRDGKRPRLAD